MSSAFGLDGEELDCTFPFHVAFDEAMCIVQLGSKLAKLCPGLQVGDHFEDHFEISRPKLVAPTFERIVARQTTIFMVRAKTATPEFRGQMLCKDPERGILFFLGTPWVADVNALGEQGVSLNDFPIHNPLPDLLFMMQAQAKAVADLRALAKAVTDQAELREKIAATEAESSAKSKFLATFSHELRTPMNGVLGMIDLLADTNLDAHQREYLDVVRRSGAHMLTLVNEILDFSAASSGQFVLRPKAFDLTGLLEEVSAPFEAMAQAAGIEFVVQTEPSLPRWLVGDPLALRKILTNLLGNAAKFTSRGSIRLDVRCTSIPGNRVQLGFRVRDSGIGIPDDQLRTVFEAFKQVDSSTSRRHGGTGLGLAIVRELVECMGGQVGVRSKQGQGSEFCFDIDCPRAQAPEPAELAPSAPARSQPIAGLEVLVVEDNRVNQRVATSMLRRLGCVCETVDGGTAALSITKSRAFDIILMDCQMPDMDGFTATERLRARDGHVVPIIAMTANVGDDDRKRCFAAGMDDFIGKPVQLDTLRSVLGRWAERAQAA